MSRSWSVPVLVLALVAGLGACGDTTDVALPEASTRYTAGDVPVLVPGRPGESVEVVQPGEAATMANPTVYTQADLDFVEGMVPHHAQALEMAELAAERARDERVKAIAERIIAAQGPEIAALQAWRESQGLPAVDEESMHSGMVGMASEEQLLQLVAADGEDFDALFLQLMTVHHEGALAMAEAAVDARNPQITELVDDTVASQGAEIGRMQQVLADLG